MLKVWADIAVLYLCQVAPSSSFTAITSHRRSSSILPQPIISQIPARPIKTTRQSKFYNLGAQKDDNNESSSNSSSSEHPQNKEDSPSSETPLDKALRKARARAEIERLTTGPESIPDRDAELKKLIGGISTGLSPNSPEARAERHCQTLESAMARSVAEGDFKAAARARDEIDRLHIDDCGFVLQANSRFYEAFSEKDYEGMKGVWLRCETVQCVHPSHAPLVGYKNVVESWKSLFDSDIKAFQTNVMEPSNIKLSVKGCTAWLTCDEEVYTPKFVRGVGKTKELVKKMMATNIFRKIDGKWYMVHHHASWHSDFDNTTKMNGKLTKKGGKQDMDGAISLGGIGGLGGLLGGGGNNGESPVVKRVVMGSLSDLLGGGLSDIISGIEKGEGSTGAGKTIIRIDGDFDDDDEDDDDDDDEVVELNRGDVESLRRQSGVPKDAIRQNCISALRKLCSQGSISHKQKRLLLTDIIACSAKGEFSLVEVAYELLCGEGDDKDAAEEDFADQCRVFASALPDVPSRS